MGMKSTTKAEAFLVCAVAHALEPDHGHDKFDGSGKSCQACCPAGQWCSTQKEHRGPGPNNEFCTRPIGHKGPHVACFLGELGHYYSVWQDHG